MAMMLESYPMITDIEFLGEEHTRAAARIAVGSQGCTVALEKDQGIWKTVRLANMWIA
jgi:hypothetical protein